MARAKTVKVKSTGKVYRVKPKVPKFQPKQKGNKYA